MTNHVADSPVFKNYFLLEDLILSAWLSRALDFTGENDNSKVTEGLRGDWRKRKSKQSNPPKKKQTKQKNHHHHKHTHTRAGAHTHTHTNHHHQQHTPKAKQKQQKTATKQQHRRQQHETTQKQQQSANQTKTKQCKVTRQESISHTFFEGERRAEAGNRTDVIHIPAYPFHHFEVIRWEEMTLQLD